MHNFGITIILAVSILVLPLCSFAQFQPDTPLSEADASFKFDIISPSVVSSAGDVNGDGLNDFLIGIRGAGESGSRHGAVYLFLGRVNADWGTNFDIKEADAVFIGEESGDEAGTAVAGVGDVNGDGFSDFIIGAPLNDAGALRGGNAYLFFGMGTAGWGAENSLSNADVSFPGEVAEDNLGEAVAGAGDVNGDGLADILISAPDNDDGAQNAGKVYLILGRQLSAWQDTFDLSEADAAFTGATAGDRAGTSLAGSGDIDMDGRADFIIGAPNEDSHGESSGMVYVFFGDSIQTWDSSSTVNAAVEVCYRESSGELFGASLSGGRDLNGDGFGDFLIGVPGYDYVTQDVGSVRTLNSGSHQIDLIPLIGCPHGYGFSGGVEGEAVGSSVAFTGDIYGFGYTSFITGAPYNGEGGANAGKIYMSFLDPDSADVMIVSQDYHASFFGSTQDALAGASISGIGDVNGDGLDDFAVSSFREVWVFLGKKAGVMPGDTNNDGVVDERDILPLGIYFLKSGKTRNDASLTWESQESFFWEGFAQTYADGNGDGVIDERDLIPIGINWSRTHTPIGVSYSISPNDIPLLRKHEKSFILLLNALDGNPISDKVRKMLYWIDETKTPGSFRLLHNYPNPFNGMTSITFSIPEPMRVILTVYDVLGHETDRLVDNAPLEAGEYSITWEDEGRSSGIYLLKLSAGGHIVTHKMVLMK